MHVASAAQATVLYILARKGANFVTSLGVLNWICIRKQTFWIRYVEFPALVIELRTCQFKNVL